MCIKQGTVFVSVKPYFGVKTPIFIDIIDNNRFCDKNPVSNMAFNCARSKQLMTCLVYGISVQPTVFTVTNIYSGDRNFGHLK